MKLKRVLILLAITIIFSAVFNIFWIEPDSLYAKTSNVGMFVMDNIYTEGSPDYYNIKSDSYSKEALENVVKKIKKAESDYNKQLDKFKKRLIIMYQLTDSSSYSSAFLSSKSLFDFYNKMNLMTSIAKKDRELLLNLSLAKKEVELNKKILLELKKKKVVSGNGSSLIVTKSEADKEVEKMEMTKELIEATLNAVIEESKGIPKFVSGLVDMDSEYAGGSMVWPVPSSKKITSPYGNRIHPILGYKKFHSGIDISASYGKSVVSANAGKVIFSGWRGGYGYCVMIDHGGRIATLYAHNSSLVVSKGATITAGQTIAKIGSTGSSTGNHLHFEVIVGNENGDFTNIDPEKYVE